MKKNAIVIAILAVLSFSAQASDCYSEGVRTGTVQKFSQKGMVNKSWEGEMVQEGFRTKGNGKMSNIWKFSVLDPAVAKKIDEAVFNGGQVAVRYCQKSTFLSADTPYLITDVKVR